MCAIQSAHIDVTTIVIIILLDKTHNIFVKESPQGHMVTINNLNRKTID